MIRLEAFIVDESATNIRDGIVGDFKGLGVVPYLFKSAFKAWCRSWPRAADGEIVSKPQIAPGRECDKPLLSE